jgi:rfaE bifunctional protein nucleotidyltransferase chain/domain
LSEAVLDAVVAAHGFLCSGGVSSLRLEPPPSAIAPDASRRQDSLSAVLAEISRVRRRGGVVVATGGCFDVLHAGHLSLLRSARALGDHLVVLVNSDSSVRRLKGRGRPVTSEGDRASILRALEVVDSVLVFDDDVPLAFLERLRPDLFVKGGDYAGRVIPEAGVLSRWGGQVVVVPYLDGRSTTGLLAKARS